MKERPDKKMSENWVLRKLFGSNRVKYWGKLFSSMEEIFVVQFTAIQLTEIISCRSRISISADSIRCLRILLKVFIAVTCTSLKGSLTVLTYSVVIRLTQHPNCYNIHLFITYTTCFGRRFRPSSFNATTIWKVNWGKVCSTWIITLLY